jgi:molecular chaperone GrpE
MDKVVKIPIRVQSPAARETRSGVAAAAHYAEDPERPLVVEPAESEPAVAETYAARELAPPSPGAKESTSHLPGPREGNVDWQDLALRLQAEMDNYRKRQQRLAQDQIEAERQRLLRGFLPIVDDLERALKAPAGNEPGLREGVHLTHRALLQRLGQEGVEKILPQNQPFDPNWHEAISAVPHDGSGVGPGTVIQVLEPGYRLGNHLLRPARVIVAV